jgi:hypothetical protein
MSNILRGVRKQARRGRGDRRRRRGPASARSDWPPSALFTGITAGKYGSRSGAVADAGVDRPPSSTRLSDWLLVVGSIFGIHLLANHRVGQLGCPLGTQIPVISR